MLQSRAFFRLLTNLKPCDTMVLAVKRRIAKAMKAEIKEIRHLESLYEGRNVYHGELHNHADTGGTSDGKRSLEHWKGAMEALKLDFAAILDHKQVRHMYLPEWEDGLFIGGTEPGTVITDSSATKKDMHYNMIFERPDPLMELLENFPEFEFTGGPEGHFVYPQFTTERFCELIDAVMARGGFFVHPHPKLIMQSENPLDYFFREFTGLEVFYKSMNSAHTAKNYELWTSLLGMGKKLYATAGCDNHACCYDTALTTIYSEEKTNKAFINYLRHGDFVCGSVGIKMCIGDNKMGSCCDFSGQRLIIGVGDFHRSVFVPERKYRIDIITDSGIVESVNIKCTKPTYLSLDADPSARFYRVEIVDVKNDLRICIGNPIFNILEIF